MLSRGSFLQDRLSIVKGVYDLAVQEAITSTNRMWAANSFILSCLLAFIFKQLYMSQTVDISFDCYSLITDKYSKYFKNCSL